MTGIVYEEFFEGAASGVFVDIGAARPDFLSISAFHRAIGWRVIAIEPNPEFCELHRARGHEVLQYACGDRDQDNVDFTIADSHECDYRGGCRKYRPHVLIIENFFNDDAYRRYMAERGYTLWRVIERNDVYLRAKPLTRFAQRLRRLVGMGSPPMAGAAS